MVNEKISKDDGKVVEPDEIEFGISELEADVLDPSTVAQPTSAPTQIPTNMHSTTKAIEEYVNFIGGRYSIDTELQPFFAYFCTIEAKGEGYRLKTIPHMKLADALEALNIVTDGRLPTDIQYFLLNADKNTPLEDITKISYENFNEARILEDKLSGYSTATTHPYFQLLKLLPRGRTWFAGVIHYLEKTKTIGFDEERVKVKQVGPPKLAITTAEFIDYAEHTNMDMRELPFYLSMLQENLIDLELPTTLTNPPINMTASYPSQSQPKGPKRPRI